MQVISATIAVGQSYPPEELDTEFKKRYPPDQFGEEMAPNARVWKVYRDEASAQDEATLDGWNKTLDILLIFAGLFSAVATAFIIESYKLLQPDFDEYTARALFALLSARNGSGTPDMLVALPDPSVVSLTRTSRWINGLWLTSLLLSLAVALLCIMVKQWLGQYTARTTASSESLQHWARRRSLYFRGLMTWRLPAFISTLPLLLHLALFLFLAGLVILFWDLDLTIALWLLLLTASLTTFYMVCFVLPAWWVECPSSTPLLSMVMHVWNTFYTSICGYLMRLIDRSSFKRPCTAPVDASADRSPTRLRRLPRAFHQYLTTSYYNSNSYYDHGELSAIQGGADDLDAAAVEWLTCFCSNPDVAVVSIQATGAMHPSSRAAEILRLGTETRNAIRRHIHAAYDYAPPRDASDTRRQANVARFVRASLCLQFDDMWDRHTTHLLSWMQGVAHYDFPFLSTLDRGGMLGRVDNAALAERVSESPHDSSKLPFLASTGVLALTAADVSLSNRIKIVNALDFRQFLVPDADCITKSMLHVLGRTCHADGGRCDVACAMELFCELALHPRSAGLDDADVRTAISVVQQLVAVPSVVTHSGRLPHFMAFLTSEFFARVTWSLQEVDHMSYLVRHAVQGADGYDSRARSTDLMLAFLRMLRLAGDLSQTSRDPRRFTVIINRLALALCDAYLPTAQPDSPQRGSPQHPHPPWLHGTEASSHCRDALLQRGPLALLERLDGQPSPWHLLTTAWRESPSPAVLGLANILAAHLCAWRRIGVPGLATLVDEFFAPDWGLTVLATLCWDPAVFPGIAASTRVFEQVLRHCGELERDWWAAVLRQAAQLDDRGQNPDIKLCARRLDAMFMKHTSFSPCMICPSQVSLHRLED